MGSQPTGHTSTQRFDPTKPEGLSLKKLIHEFNANSRSQARIHGL